MYIVTRVGIYQISHRRLKIIYTFSVEFLLCIKTITILFDLTILYKYMMRELLKL